MCPLEVVSNLWWVHFKSLHAMRVNMACIGTDVSFECLSLRETS